ncbi:heme oxygenase 1 isoform X2 [Anabrus simplex]
MTDVYFTKQMRKATREIHAASDALVNAKLAFALSDNSVWAEGLLIFYEIFRYLEEAMDRLKDKHVGELDIEGMRRTKAFEQDLNFYLGNDWQKNYTPRESVAKYLLYLSKLETSDPDMLMAYIYHLYMGLLSGGQILARKRAIYKKLLPFSKQAEGGYAVTSFGDYPISKIKRNLVKAMNDVAQNLDEDTKNKLIEESKTVFVMNNEIIRTVEGANKVFLKKMAVAVAAVAVIAAAYAIWKHR